MIKNNDNSPSNPLKQLHNLPSENSVSVIAVAIVTAPLWIPILLLCVAMTPRERKFREMMA